MALVLTAVALSVPSVAYGQTWTPVAPGVDRYSATIAGPNRVRATRINLCYPGVRMRATTFAEKGQKTSNWAPSVGVVAAVNGGFFKFGSFAPDQGVAWGGQAAWPNSADTGARGWIAFGDRQIDHAPAWAVGEPPAWTWEAINGDATLVIDGVAVDCGGCGTVSPRPRTAVGYTADRQTVYFVTVDGDNTGSVGMLIDEFAQLVATFGVDRAMNVDGGGSTTHWAAGVGLTNIPSNGSERTVSNHLGVFSPGGGLTPHCPSGYHATYVGGTFAGGSGTAVTLEPGETSTVYLDFQNSGSETWQGPVRLATLPYDEPSLLAHPSWISPGRIVDVDAPTPPGETGRFSFSVTAPSQLGVYTQQLDLLHEGVAWFSQSWGPAAGSFWIEVTVVAPPAWRADVVDVSGFSGSGTAVAGTIGATVSGTVEVKNTGAEPWPAGVVKLGTTEPRDHASAQATGDWLSANRVVANPAVVAPGQSVVLPVSFQLPDTVGEVSESFGFVAEGITWFADAGGPADDALTFVFTTSDPPPEPTPEVVEPGPEPVESGPETVEPGPEPVEAGPETVEPGPEPVESGPETVEPGPDLGSEIEVPADGPLELATDAGPGDADTDNAGTASDLRVEDSDGYSARFVGSSSSSLITGDSEGCAAAPTQPVGTLVGLGVLLLAAHLRRRNDQSAAATAASLWER